MQRFLALCLIAVLVLGVGLVSADGHELDLSETTVTYWHQYSEGSAQGDTMATLVEDFNANNEWGITVDAVFQGGYNEIRELMNGAIISGEMPNLVAGFQNDAASYALDGVVVDLNEFLDSEDHGFGEEAFGALNQGILNANVFEYSPFDGAMLAWPNQISGNALSVNNTMLAELGFDSPPTTFEDFEAIACAAAESGMTGAEDVEVRGYPIKPDASNFESFMAGMGGQMYDVESDSYDFTGEAAIATLQFYADLYANGCAYIPDSRFGNTDDFALGINPMALGSTAGLPFIASGFEESGVEAEWVMTTTPFTEGNRTLQLFIPSIIMVQGTPEQNLASWLFIKYLAEEDNQVTWSSATAYLPVDTNAAVSVAEAIAEDNPILAGVFDLLAEDDLNIYTAPNLVSYGAIRGLIAEAVSNVTVNGMDVVEAAEALTEQANETHADLSE